MFSDDSYLTQTSTYEDLDKFISDDLPEIYTIFRYISNNLTYHQSCLQNLKVLELGSSSGENLSLALEHGASFVAGLDPSQSMVQSSINQFEKARIDLEKFSFIRANIYSFNSCELNIPSSFKHFFDKVFSCWAISSAKSLLEVTQLIKVAIKCLKANGDIVLVFVNPKIVENFSVVKDLPRIENFRLVDVEQETDHFRIQAQILEPYSEKPIMNVSYNVFQLEDIEKILNEFGFVVKHSGALQMKSEDEYVSYSFDMISKEISKETTLGYYMHVKRPPCQAE